MIVEPALEPHRYTTFPEERRVIVDLMRQALRNVKYIHGAAAVEIGAYKGETTAVLLPAWGAAPYHVIDPWDGQQDASDQGIFDQFYESVWPYLGREISTRTSKDMLPAELIVHRARSQDVDPPPNITFVFHDGDHREPDFQKWYDALIPGGVLVIHDFHEPGWPKVREAAEALGRPWHEYTYAATSEEHAEYGPATRGLFWKWKP